MSETGPFLPALLLRKVEDLERRVRRMFFMGSVTDVDPAKRLVRVDDGLGTEGVPNKTDWLPWAELSGSLKTKTLPKVGQQVAVLSPSGLLEQGLVIPGYFTDQDPKPDSDQDDYVLTNGKVKVAIKGSAFTITVGSTEVEIKDGTVNIKADQVITVGKTYLGENGKDQTQGDKVLTEAGNARKVWSPTE